MRRQVIAGGAALVLGLSLITAPSAWARGDGGDWSNQVTPGGGGHDVSAEVWRNGGGGGSSGTGGSSGSGAGQGPKEATSVDGQTPADAAHSLDNRRSRAA